MEVKSEKQSYKDLLAEYGRQLAAAEEEARAAQAKIALLKERLAALNELIDEVSGDAD